MTLKVNHDWLEDQAARPGRAIPVQVQDSSLYGEITGQIAVGRYVLQVGEPIGVLLREASRAERAHIRPRPTPILLRPRLIRGLVGRRTEVAAALSALDAGLPVEAFGDPGIGKTAFLRHLAHHPRASAFVDGIVYLQARHRSAGDLVQFIFEAFYESDEICKPTDAEIRRGLQDKQALILLDDVQLPRHELEQILDTAPQSAFVVATRERCLWSEVRSVALNGLPADDAVLVLERQIERPLDDKERSAAASLCATLGGHPLRIFQAAAIVREFGILLDDCARNITPASLLMELLASVDEKQRRVLLALTALPGVPLQAQHVASIADITDVESSLMTLVRCGLVVSAESRHRLAAGVADQLRRKEDLNPWVHRAITYFTAWAERYRRSPVSLLEEAEALMRTQQSAIDAHRWGEVLRLGRMLEGALVIGARWGAWATVLQRCLTAAKAMGDRPAEAWVMHETGTRAVCLGETGVARGLLGQAMKLREAIDHDAAAASRRNLGFVLGPVFDHSRGRATTGPGGTLDVDGLPLRVDPQPSAWIATRKSINAVPLAALLVAILGGLVYWAPSTRLSSINWRGATLGSVLQNTLSAATTAFAPQSVQPESELRVVYFSTVPDHVAPGESVRLCYEVANGARVRIDPEIGELGALARNCVSAAPMETTTYTLTADGAHGESLRRTMRVMVGRPSPNDLVAEETRAAAASGMETLESEPQMPAAAPAAPSDRASIAIFTPRPGSITAGGPARLCYAVSSALQARIEPGVGVVRPASTLTCVGIAPTRTTTYELTASGQDGHQVRQQLVIVVR